MKKIILLSLFLLGMSICAMADNPKKEKPTKEAISAYNEKLSDYNAVKSYLSHKFETAVEQHESIPYVGIFQIMIEKENSLYVELLTSYSDMNEFVIAPTIPLQTCWYCRCLSYFCGRIVAVSCSGGMSCPGLCPYCGEHSVVSFAGGQGCNGMVGQECAYQVL